MAFSVVGQSKHKWLKACKQTLTYLCGSSRRLWRDIPVHSYRSRLNESVQQYIQHIARSDVYLPKVRTKLMDQGCAAVFIPH